MSRYGKLPIRWYFIWVEAYAHLRNSSFSDPAKKAELCQCPNCVQKQIIIEQSEPYKKVKNFFIMLAIISGWVLLGFLAVKVSQFDYEMSNFDPYEILGLPPGATQAEIKRSYRKQSLILHPDKETGDEKAFMKLTKAYQVRFPCTYYSK